MATPPAKPRTLNRKAGALKVIPTGSRHTPRRALVLGEQGAAEQIARRLKEEGFLPETIGEPLPSLSDENALEKLRAILTRFAERAVEQGAGPGSAPCLHPGVSVWAERPEIATLGEELGLDVICPPARVLALFANKLNLLTEADRLGIPHLVMNFEPVYSTREIERLVFNQSLGRKPFPFVLKSVKGGGSFGVYVVQEPGDLERKIPLWVEQVRRNMGEVSLFAERYLESARHILVPFVRHVDGRFRVFPMTDASLQCRYRKIIELCPATGISHEMQGELTAWTRKLADACGYVGVGTVEYLVDDTRAFLIEGAARLSTGFHLWERVAGTSAVSWQLSALEGGVPGEEPVCEPRADWAAGLSLRLYAEDSLLQLPQPGEVREVSEKREWHFDNPALQASAELNLQVKAGSRIESTGHGMLGVLWVGSANRKQVLNFARGVLDELWIAGSIQTNERFIGELLAHPWVQEGMFHAGFVDEEFLPSVRPPMEILQSFWFVTAAAVTAQATLPGGAPPGSTAPSGAVHWSVGDQWVKPEAVSQNQSARWREAPVSWTREGWGGISGWVVLADGRQQRCCAFPIAEGKWQVRVGHWVLPVRRVLGVTGTRPKRTPKLLALVQGRIHAVLYREGTVVPAHEPLLVLDSLGMLVPHAVPVDVRITEWKKMAEETVQAGEALADLEIVSKG